MKKLALIFLSTILIVGFYSCKKESLSSTAPAESLSVLMSVPKNGSLKSASVSQTIKNGDTAKVYDALGINVVISVVDQFGSAVDGEWAIFNIDNDRNINGYDAISIGFGGGGYFGPVVSTKLLLGLYEAHFLSKSGTQMIFYIRHTGMPGSVGDDWQCNYAFRLDYENYQIANTFANKGYTLYIRYDDGEFPTNDTPGTFNPSDPQNFRALLYCDENIFVSKGGFTYLAKEFKLTKCKYSPGYYHFSFASKSAPPLGNRYLTYFYSGTFGDLYWGFRYVRKSNWNVGDQIAFYPLN